MENIQMAGLFILAMLILTLGQQTAPNPQVCSSEVSLCPNGVYVNRNPDLNCDFDLCPELDNAPAVAENAVVP